MAIQQNFPDEGPTLNLNFAGSRTLDPRITFTRTSSATYTGPDGLIKIAPVNSPRFDHLYNSTTGEIESLGLLIEEARTNSVRRSQELDESSVWDKNNVGITTNATIAPDGTLSAEKLIDDVSINTQHWLRIRCVGISTNTFVTASTFFKFDPTNLSARGMSLTVTDAETGGSSYSAINIKVNGTSTISAADFPNTTGKLISLPNGWYRAHVTFTNANISELALRLQLFQDSNNNVVYTGDGTSGIYIWGAQVEVGTFPTSYIPTQGSTATRTADNASMRGENFSSWYNQSEGTLFSIASTADPSSVFPTLASFNDGTTQNRIQIGRTNGNNAANRSFITKDNVDQAIIIFGSTSQNQLAKLSLGWNQNSVIGTMNNLQSIEDTNALIPTVSRLQLGAASSTSSFLLNGHISQLTYYPRRLSNEFLQNLTR